MNNFFKGPKKDGVSIYVNKAWHRVLKIRILIYFLIELSMSSSEEDTSHLADCVYEVAKPKINGSENGEAPKSNRFLPDEHKQFDYKNLKVTASFRKHVSKHLEALLEDTKFVKPKKNVKIKKRKKEDESGGITLLSSSQTSLVLTDSAAEFPVKRKKPKRKQKNEVSEEELEKRAKEVAVTPEYVLSKKETLVWAPETKGKTETIQCKR